MEREPIIREQDPLGIELVQNAISLYEVIPNYSYRFQERQVSEESNNMYNNFLEFLQTNEELIDDNTLHSREDFVKGFQKSIAMLKLWIDSLYIEQ